MAYLCSLRLNADGIKEVVFLELFSGKSISRKPDVAELIPIKKFSVAMLRYVEDEGIRQD